jgi:hypothetical protein
MLYAIYRSIIGGEYSTSKQQSCAAKVEPVVARRAIAQPNMHVSNANRSSLTLKMLAIYEEMLTTRHPPGTGSMPS